MSEKVKLPLLDVRKLDQTWNSQHLNHMGCQYCKWKLSPYTMVLAPNKIFFLKMGLRNFTGAVKGRNQERELQRFCC